MIAGLEHSARARAMLAGAGIRIIEMLDTDGVGIDIVVGFSNREAGRVSARHLVSRGYRRIGYVGHDLSRDLRAAKRFEGFRSALAEAGLEVAAQAIISAPSSIEAGRDGLARILEEAPGVDAVYFSNDDMAIGGYFLCLSRAIAIPARLALFGYNGLDVARCAPQPLSTIRTPRVAVGETSARLLCSDGPPTVVELDFELIEGATT
jgi:LacI family gluconate utilization system Gnt-I transcriptional repressor